MKLHARALPCLILALALSQSAYAETTRSLIAKVENGSLPAQVRSKAAEALADRHDPAAIQALASALRTDSSEDVRQSAARALGESSGSPSTRRIAAQALEESISQDASYGVRSSARGSLEDLLDRSPKSFVRETNAALITDLGVPSSRGKALEISILQAYGDETALAPIVEQLQHSKDEDTRAAAVQALAHFQKNKSGTDVSELAMRALQQDPSYMVRYQSASALTAMAPQDKTIVDRLMALARAPARSQENATQALVNIADPRAIPVFKDLLSPSTDQDVRYDAIRGLEAQSSNPDAIRAALTVLRDKDEYVRTSARYVLRDGLTKAFPKLTPEERITAMNALIEDLGSADPGARTKAALLISQVMERETRLHPHSKLARVISHCLPKDSNPAPHGSGIALFYDILFFAGAPVVTTTESVESQSRHTPRVERWKTEEIESLRYMIDNSLKS